MTGLKGRLSLPGDKSITHRALILSALADGPSRIRGYLPSEDCQHTIKAFLSMGISIRESSDGGIAQLDVEGKGLFGLSEPKDVIDCGNSGTTMRLLTGLLAAQPFFSVLTGDSSLRKRPMRRVIDPLRMMGADIAGRSESNQAPLAISGKKLRPIHYDLPMASAQVKTSILLAGLSTVGMTKVTEPGPSRDHTERMFDYFGIPFKKEGNTVSLGGGFVFCGKPLDIPGDISSAAFFLVAASILDGSELNLENVGINSTRTGVLEVLQAMGADITIKTRKSLSNEPVADLTVRSAVLKGCVIEGDLMTRAIDEFPILCIAAAHAEGMTFFKDASELRVKESDRIEMMAVALRGMGITVETFPDGISITGKPDWKGCDCKTAGDHRIAMSMVVAGLKAEGGNRIDDMDCINTSFPGFMVLLSRLLAT